MINRIVDAALGNRMVVLILIAALVAVGLLSMQRLPFDADPDISPLQVLVTTHAPGSPPWTWSVRSPRRSSSPCRASQA